jgi:ABC-type dipeptide/oligopeptide/nickel transport system permease subunit
MTSHEHDRSLAGASSTAGAAVPLGGDGHGDDAQRSLVYESGLEVEVRSQWTYARRRFLRHRLAVVSLVVLIVVLGAGLFAPWVAPYSFEGYDINSIQQGPSWDHPFGTDLLGRDYFSRVIYGIRTSERVAFIVAGLTVLIGTLIGMVAGYFGGWIDNLLMRLTDLILTLPGLAVLLTAAAFLGNGSQYRVAIILALLLWTALARLVRGNFLSLREKEYVDAAKAAGAGDVRIMFRHMLPNSLGPIIVSGTLTLGLAIILEAALSYLGFGVLPPTPALGKLIADGQDVSQHAWWLVTFPGLTIVVIVLCVNFIGDGLRDALDPTQRVRA